MRFASFGFVTLAFGALVSTLSFQNCGARNSARSSVASSTTSLQSAATFGSEMDQEAGPATALKVISQANQIYFSLDGQRNPEVTPWVINQGAHNAFLIPTLRTHLCSREGNFLAAPFGEDIAVHGTCHLKSLPMTEHPNGSNPGKVVEEIWKRNYHGAFSGHILTTVEGPKLFTINHGELKSERRPSEDCPYGSLNLGYGDRSCPNAVGDDWASYNAFITMSQMNWSAVELERDSLFNDFGPITWPSNGYIESLNGRTVKATNGGVRHPSSIVFGGYLYVFYEDLSLGSEREGRGPGIKVMRAPLNSNGIEPLSFKTYFNGEFSEPALPDSGRFNVSRVYQYWSRKGGRSTAVVKSLAGPFIPMEGTGRTEPFYIGDVSSFSVAKVKGQDLFVGVGLEDSRGTTLRFSKNLVDWSEPWIIPGTEGNLWAMEDRQKNYERYSFLYPRLLRSDGTSNTEIDPELFYVIGMQRRPYPARDNPERKIVNYIPIRLSRMHGGLFRSLDGKVFYSNGKQTCSFPNVESFRSRTGMSRPDWVPPAQNTPPNTGPYVGSCDQKHIQQ